MSVISNCDFESNLAEMLFYDKCVMDIGIQHDTRIKNNSTQTKLGEKKTRRQKIGQKNRHKTLGSKKIGKIFFTHTSISNYHTIILRVIRWLWSFSYCLFTLHSVYSNHRVPLRLSYRARIRNIDDYVSFSGVVITNLFHFLYAPRGHWKPSACRIWPAGRLLNSPAVDCWLELTIPSISRMQPSYSQAAQQTCAGEYRRSRDVYMGVSPADTARLDKRRRPQGATTLLVSFSARNPRSSHGGEVACTIGADHPAMKWPHERLPGFEYEATQQLSACLPRFGKAVAFGF